MKQLRDFPYVYIIEKSALQRLCVIRNQAAFKRNGQPFRRGAAMAQALVYQVRLGTVMGLNSTLSLLAT